MILKKISILFLFICISILSYAQTGTIRGFVYEKETGEPMMFTNVYIKENKIGSSTDVNGFFNISKVPAGSYTLLVTSIGYDTLKIPITIKAGGFVNQKLYVEKK